MPIINMYNTAPKDVKEGDVGLMIVKVMVSDAYGLDGEWAPHFKLYRCPYPPNPVELIMTDGEPQGDKIHGSAALLNYICLSLYPTVIQAGILPNPDSIS